MILCVACAGCSDSIDTNFDNDILPVLQKFQKVVNDNPEKLKGDYGKIADGYRWIVEENFKRLFPFMEDKDAEEIMELFRAKKVARIEVWDNQCILFKIRPATENMVTRESWEELYIAYYDECACVCHKRINQTEIPAEKIFQLDDKWFKVIAKNRRYIGG